MHQWTKNKTYRRTNAMICRPIVRRPACKQMEQAVLSAPGCWSRLTAASLKPCKIKSEFIHMSFVNHYDCRHQFQYDRQPLTNLLHILWDIRLLFHRLSETTCWRRWDLAEHRRTRVLHGDNHQNVIHKTETRNSLNMLTTGKKKHRTQNWAFSAYVQASLV